MMHPWFEKAKLGIFIHWGICTVDGNGISWPMARAMVSCDEYYAQRHNFTADQYDPAQWAKLIKATGANYAVLTTKHHDGFAIFDTKFTDNNTVKSTPCGRDLVEPYCQALRDEGIKVGLYFSNTDWADDDHLRVILDMSQEELDAMRKVPTNFEKLYKETGKRELGERKEEYEACWERFMTRYKGEIRELLTNYQPDILWFDVMWKRNGLSWETPEVKKMIEELSPKTICNGRLGNYGDYECPENYIPLSPLGCPWELCESFNKSWSYRKPFVDSYKNMRQVVRMFCECISKGGNLLINITPDDHGVIPEETVKRMLELGQWTGKYAEAIYPTVAGLNPAYFLGGSTLSEDNKTLYLFAYDCGNGQIMLNGIHNKVKRITALSNGKELTHKVLGGAWWINIPGSIWIDIPEDAIDELCTVIKVEFDEPINLLPLNDKTRSLGEG